jgi:membrane-associated protease RseP (regulator of RpoE activity)
LAALGLALSLLVAPMAARAQDDEDDQDNGRQGTVRIYESKDGNNSARSGGYLGVQVQDVTRTLQRARNLPTEQGAMVSRVEPSSPADRSGIRRGDVIVEVNGDKIEDSADLIRTVRKLDSGENARVTLWRGGSLRTITAELGERPQVRPDMPPDMGRRSGNDEDIPMPPMPPSMGDRGFSDRDQVQVRQQIRELQDQLRQLREELRALRMELRQSRDNGDDDSRSRNNRDDD